MSLRSRRKNVEILKKIKYFRIKLLNINHQIKFIRMKKTNTTIKITRLILKAIIETIIKQIIKKIEIVKIDKTFKIVILFIRKRQINNVYSRSRRRRNKFFETNLISLIRCKFRRLFKFLFRYITSIIKKKKKNLLRRKKKNRNLKTL